MPLFGLAGLAERLKFLVFLSLADFLREGNGHDFLMDRPRRGRARGIAGDTAGLLKARIYNRSVWIFWQSCWMLVAPPGDTSDQFVQLRIIHPLVVGARGSRGRDEIDVAFRHGPERMKRMASGANAGRALWRAEMVASE